MWACARGGVPASFFLSFFPSFFFRGKKLIKKLVVIVISSYLESTQLDCGESKGIFLKAIGSEGLHR